jgi:hypothetical protein
MESMGKTPSRKVKRKPGFQAVVACQKPGFYFVSGFGRELQLL